MVTPWTIPKLVTWRVKDWASCFVSSKFPLDDDSKKRDSRMSLSPRIERKNKIRVSGENRRLSWPPHVSDEEDYIVFCFKENGVLDVSDDDLLQPDRLSCDNHTDSRTINPKGKNDVEEEERVTDSAAAAAESNSNELNQSDGSRGSFAFPILGKEWIGSPVQMPKVEEDLGFKKHKAIIPLGFQCCRF